MTARVLLAIQGLSIILLAISGIRLQNKVTRDEKLLMLVVEEKYTQNSAIIQCQYILKRIDSIDRYTDSVIMTTNKLMRK